MKGRLLLPARSSIGNFTRSESVVTIRKTGKRPIYNRSGNFSRRSSGYQTAIGSLAFTQESRFEPDHTVADVDGIGGRVIGCRSFSSDGGVVLIVAGICSFASIVVAFRESYEFGMGLLIFELALVPVFTWIFVKVWPKTPLGRRMIIEPAQAESYQWKARELVGQVGITTCEMLPAGEIEIDGRRWDATSRAGLIAIGTPVKVVDEEMGQLYVVPVGSLKTTNVAPAPAKDSVFDRPAEEIGIEKLD